jgi:hypothetical protein
MKKYLNIIAGIIALVSLMETVFFTDQTFDLFTFEVNIWIARVFWLIVFLGISYDLYKVMNKQGSLKKI